jgi:hypothetical protein
MQQCDLIVDYVPLPQFAAFHRRRERFASIVTHRRAGKTVANPLDRRKSVQATGAITRPWIAHSSVSVVVIVC